jgi:hypothetical protein
MWLGVKSVSVTFRSVKLMPSEAEAQKPVAKSKQQIEAEFKKLHTSGFDQLGEIEGFRLRGGATKKDSTDTQAGE